MDADFIFWRKNTMSTTKKNNTKVLVECALLIAIATVLNVVCSFIPFLNLPFGGGFTVCSMLPIVLAAYRNGTKWGLLTGFVYAVVQMLLGFKTVSAFFMPGSDSYMVLWKAVCVCLIDYIIAYTVLGLGGIFRNKIKNPSVSLCVGSIFALSLRYIAHIISGFIFFGTWADCSSRRTASPSAQRFSRSSAARVWRSSIPLSTTAST